MLSLEEEPEVELSNGTIATIISAAAVCVLLLVVVGVLGLYYRSRVQGNTEQDFIKMEYIHPEHTDAGKVCVIDTLSFCDDQSRNSGPLQR